MPFPDCHFAICRINAALRIFGFALKDAPMHRLALIAGDGSKTDLDLMTAFARELHDATTPPQVQAAPSSATHMLMVVAGGYRIVLQKLRSGEWNIGLAGEKFDTWTDIKSAALLIVLGLSKRRRIGKKVEVRRLLVAVYGRTTADAHIEAWERAGEGNSLR